MIGTLLLLIAVNVTAGIPWQWFASPNEDMEIGVNFSCRRAMQLMPEIDCHALYASVLDDLGSRHIRLAVYWDEIEPRRGAFDFTEIDWYVEQAAARGATVVPVLGMKGTYRPEFYIPGWLMPEAAGPEWSPGEDVAVREAVVVMLRTVVTHLAASPAIEAWQVENEPDARPDGDTRGWTVPDDLLRQETHTVRESDPAGRPAILTDDSSRLWQRSWIGLLDRADIFGLSMYTRRPGHAFPGSDVERRYEIGAASADIWHQVTRARLNDKQVWLVELQAEPWQERDVLDLRPEDVDSISPQLMRDNVSLARRTGASRAYLWGTEWWWFMRDRWDDDRYWRTAGDLIADGN